jgi:hypothetical protein
VKADFSSVEFTADFWYLSVVSGAKQTPIKTSNNSNIETELLLGGGITVGVRRRLGPGISLISMVDIGRLSCRGV